MRAKVRLQSVKDYGTCKELVFVPVTATSPENQAFWKATPGGKIELSVDNLDAVADMKPHDEFYVDFTRVVAVK